MRPLPLVCVALAAAVACLAGCGDGDAAAEPDPISPAASGSDEDLPPGLAGSALTVDGDVRTDLDLTLVNCSRDGGVVTVNALTRDLTSSVLVTVKDDGTARVTINLNGTVGEIWVNPGAASTDIGDVEGGFEDLPVTRSDLILTFDAVPLVNQRAPAPRASVSGTVTCPSL